MEKRMKYAVKTRFVFEGEFYVEEESAAKARAAVEGYCYASGLREIASNLGAEYVDWEFPVHPEKIVGRAKKVK